jgi:hypothetical protein
MKLKASSNFSNRSVLMKNRRYSMIARNIGIAVALLFAAVAMQAQNYKVVKGYQGSGAFDSPSYYYYYQPDNNGGYTQRQTIAGYLFFYEYYPWQLSEFVVTKTDLLAAGICPGPIDAMSLKVVKTTRNFTAGIRIFMKSVPTTQDYLPYPNYANPPQTNEGYNYYHYTVSGFISTTGSTPGIRAAPGAVEVYDNPNWSLPITLDTTWIDFPFNKGSFVWDGNSNIVVGFYKCFPNDGDFNSDYPNNMIMATYVNPPTGYGYDSNI